MKWEEKRNLHLVCMVAYGLLGGVLLYRGLWMEDRISWIRTAAGLVFMAAAVLRGVFAAREARREPPEDPKNPPDGDF